MQTTLDHLVDSAKEMFENNTLYVLATPIGNRCDLTLRAFAALSVADVVLAEDTRVTANLLSSYGLHKKLISVREQNEREMAQMVIQRLATGEKIVQVSDAGTPGISDPGARMADAVWKAGYKVCPLPGASAVVTAMSAAGLETGQFLFAGFLPPKTQQRQKTLAQWLAVDYAVICYEAPHRIEDSLKDIVEVLGADRSLVLARELTKTFETILRKPAGELLQQVQTDANQRRGEFVLIIDAAPKQTASTGLDPKLEKLLKDLVEDLPIKRAAAIVADFAGENRKKLYEIALEWKKSEK